MSTTVETAPGVVFRLSHLGDVALTTGVLTHWHEQNGNQFIFVTRAMNAPLLKNHPAVTEIVALEDNVLKGGAWLSEARRLARTYKGHPLIDLHSTLRSHLLSIFWRGTVRRYSKFGLARRLYDRTRREKYRAVLEATNVPQRYALAMEDTPPEPSSLVPRIYLTQEEKERVAPRVKDFTDGKPIIALHPYATHPAKQWPRENWLSLTGLLASAGMDWFVLGHNPEPLFADHRRDLTNKTDLRETCALIDRADLLISSDSGPMHLGTGVGTPVAALFGPTAKVWGFYPSGPKDRVLEIDMDCRPCSLHGARHCTRGHACMVGLEPEHVMRTIGEML